MNRDSLRQLLEQVKSGTLGVDQGLEHLKHMPFEDLTFAKVDHHRALRCGFPEVIYCEGKTTDQIAMIFEKCADTGVNVLATRANQQAYEAICDVLPEAEYYELARCITLRQIEAEKSTGTIAVVSAGTADLPVAEEACVTAEIMDQTVVTYYDVGVAGIHRLLAHASDIQDATVVVVAGPQTDLLPGEVEALSVYLDQGGKLLVLIDPPSESAAPEPEGLIGLLREWGIEPGTGVVQCVQPTVG